MYTHIYIYVFIDPCTHYYKPVSLNHAIYASLPLRPYLPRRTPRSARPLHLHFEMALRTAQLLSSPKPIAETYKTLENTYKEYQPKSHKHSTTTTPYNDAKPQAP